ncbi:hypothetical protein TorRG33x02_037580, partial [Trema orientale]
YNGLGLVSFVVFGALLGLKLIDMCLQGCRNIAAGFLQGCCKLISALIFLSASSMCLIR